MKIVPQSFEILKEMDPVTQIASFARLCYKSEGKAQENETPFLERIKGHEPVFEMAVVTLRGDISQKLSDIMEKSKFLHVSKSIDGAETYATGSVRSWREFIKTHAEKWNVLTNELISALKLWNDFLFKDFKVNVQPLMVFSVATEEDLQTKISAYDYKKHKHVAVRIITNRAVTHEIVRHRPVSYLQESQRYCRYDKEQFGNEVTFIDPTPFYAKGTYEYAIWMDACRKSEKAYLKLLKTSSPQAARTVLPNSCKTEIIVFCNLEEWQHIAYRRTSQAAEPSMRKLMIPLCEGLSEMISIFEPEISVG